MARSASTGLTVAVTGPTGDIGRPVLRALDRTREIAKIRGMARREFDPAAAGLRKVEYLRGDVTRRADVDRLVEGADVVIHLAFIILDAGTSESREINLRGSGNVFEAAASAGVKRLAYASSVAAYGFHGDNPQPLTEDVSARGTERHPYSAMKAEVEDLLHAVLDQRPIDTYVFRPCIVAGPEALTMVQEIPYVRIGERMPGALRALFDVMPILKPVIPDPGVPFQLVHHDDVAAAFRAAALGRGAPGVYNLAGPGEVRMRDLADELGYYTIPVPELAVDATAEIVTRLPFVPPEARWIEAVRVPVLMDAAKARRELRWRPRHSARDTLHQTVGAAREDLQPA